VQTFALLPGWQGRLIATGVAIAVALVVSRVLDRLVKRWADTQPHETADLTRLRRRETAIALARTAIRYGVFLLAALAVLGIFVHNTVATVGGASLVVILVGFGMQRFLLDVIAGFFFLFEDWYAVGDFAHFEPWSLAGIVEQVGLRTTVVRTLNGDRNFLPNGQITAVRRPGRGFRRYKLDLLVQDAEAAREQLDELFDRLMVGEDLFLTPPEVIEERALGDGLTLLRVRADVPPTMEWLAENLLVQTISRQLDSTLVAAPIAYTLDSHVLNRYQRRVLVR
jgi:moderate conductance mechanosensitive channel